MSDLMEGIEEMNSEYQIENDEIDDLCNQMKKKTKVYYDERKELEEFLEKDSTEIDLDDLKETEERYKRYLNGITVWKKGRKNFEYIKTDMETYLNEPSTSKNYFEKRKLMRKIDKELMDVILNKK